MALPFLWKKNHSRAQLHPITALTQVTKPLRASAKATRHKPADAVQSSSPQQGKQLRGTRGPDTERGRALCPAEVDMARCRQFGRGRDLRQLWGQAQHSPASRHTGWVLPHHSTLPGSINCSIASFQPGKSLPSSSSDMFGLCSKQMKGKGKCLICKSSPLGAQVGQ